MSETPFYPIHNLSDILAKFRQELNMALQDVYRRLDAIEQQLAQAGIGVSKEEQEAVSEETVEGGESIAETTVNMHKLYQTTIMARRALYGYAMALERMGLPKDQKQLIRELEYSISAMVRLYQTIMLIERAYEILTVSSMFSPMGWLYIAMAGGTALATIVYASKATGG